MRPLVSPCSFLPLSFSLFRFVLTFANTLGRGSSIISATPGRRAARNACPASATSVLLHFCLSIYLTDPLPHLFLFRARCACPFVLSRRLDRVCTRAPLSREHAAVFRLSPGEKKRKSPEGASSRPGKSRIGKTQREATEIKVSPSLSFSRYTKRGCILPFTSRDNFEKRGDVSTFCFDFYFPFFAPTFPEIMAIFLVICSVSLDRLKMNRQR